MADQTLNSNIKVNFKGEQAESKISKLTSGLKGLAAAWGLKEIAAFGYELNKMGIEALTVEKQFAAMSKGIIANNEAFMQSMTKASLKVIDDSDLMKLSIQGLLGNFTPEQIITMTEYITKYSISMGKNVEQNLTAAFESIARKRLGVFREFGLQITGDTAKAKDLIDQMDQKMGRFVVSENDAVLKQQQFLTEIKASKEAIGKNLIEPYSAVLNIISKATYHFSELVKEAKIGAQALRGNLTAGMLENKLNLGKGYFKELEAIKDERDRYRDIERASVKKEREYTEEEQKELLEIQKKYDAARFGEDKVKYQEQLKQLEKFKEDYPAKTKEINTIILDLTADFNKKQEEKRKAEKDKELEIVKDFYDEQDDLILQKNSEYRAASTKNYEELYQIETEYRQRSMTSEEIAYDNRLSMLTRFAALYPEKETEILALIQKLNDDRTKAIAEPEQKFLEDRFSKYSGFINSIATLNSSLGSLSDAYTQKAIANLDKQHMSEKRYAAAREAIEQKSLERRKKIARVQQAIAVTEGIIAVSKIWLKGAAESALPPPLNIIEAIAEAATAATQVAIIQAQNFQTGRIGDPKYARQSDTIAAMVGKGESIISAPQSAMHQEELKNIQNNVVNTRANSVSSGREIVQNFYGLTSEQFLQAQIRAERTKQIGNKF
jgi:hypothetical protein